MGEKVKRPEALVVLRLSFSNQLRAVYLSLSLSPILLLFHHFVLKLRAIWSVRLRLTSSVPRLPLNFSAHTVLPS